jgi:hypothetical protein
MYVEIYSHKLLSNIHLCVYVSFPDTVIKVVLLYCSVQKDQLEYSSQLNILFTDISRIFKILENFLKL